MKEKTEHETMNKFEEIVAHLGYIFNEKPEFVKKALTSLGSFDELILMMLSAEDMGLGLEEALMELEEPGSSYLVATKKKVESNWKDPYYVQ